MYFTVIKMSWHLHIRLFWQKAEEVWEATWGPSTVQGTEAMGRGEDSERSPASYLQWEFFTMVLWLLGAGMRH